MNPTQIVEHYFFTVIGKAMRNEMKESARYVKIVEWSDEDQCFVGQCPGIVGPCCHGADEAQVYAELCQIVDEWIEIMKKDGRPLPPPTAGKGVASKLLDAA